MTDGRASTPAPWAACVSDQGEVSFALSVPADAAARSGGEATEGGPAREELPVGEAAFTSGFREHYPACLRLARRVVRDEGLAHEVVQEVFLAWWRAAGGAYRADRGELAGVP